MKDRSRLHFECICGQPASILLAPDEVFQRCIPEGLIGPSEVRLLGRPTTDEILRALGAACSTCGRSLRSFDL